MSKYLSASRLDTIENWLRNIHNAPILLQPLHPVIQNLVIEIPPALRELEVPTYKYRPKKKQSARWKSEYLNIPSRKDVTVGGSVIRAYCNRLGLGQAYQPELNTVESMISLPNPIINELVAESSRSVLKGEFTRVLHIRNSFFAEKLIFSTLLCQDGLSPDLSAFYEMREGECQYGCEKAQGAADYIRSFAKHLGLSIDFASLLSAFPYPQKEEEEEHSCSLSSSPSNTVLNSSYKDATLVSSLGVRKRALSEAEYKDWQDKWVFQTNHRATRNFRNI